MSSSGWSPFNVTFEGVFLHEFTIHILPEYFEIQMCEIPWLWSRLPSSQQIKTRRHWSYNHHRRYFDISTFFSSHHHHNLPNHDGTPM
jgi:hypothetical protein